MSAHACLSFCLRCETANLPWYHTSKKTTKSCICFVRVSLENQGGYTIKMEIRTGCHWHTIGVMLRLPNLVVAALVCSI
jgi:hypothetical protein